LGLGGRHGEIVRMTEPLEREAVLAGYTYKIRWPGSDHAMYITINDIECEGPAGGSSRHAGGVSSTHHAGGVSSTRRRPFEIFINSKNLEHYAWTVALTRMISAIFRRGGDVSFVVEELKAVFDPQGGQWMGGRYVPSLLAAIGGIIETHMIRIGFMARPHRPDQEGEEEGAPAKALAAGERPTGLGAGMGSESGAGPGPAPAPAADSNRRRGCPRCGAQSLRRQEGCLICDNCGYSKCN
jgi:ribonucleoside-diphosphate reductase alpha chain